MVLRLTTLTVLVYYWYTQVATNTSLEVSQMHSWVLGLPTLALFLFLYIVTEFHSACNFFSALIPW